MPRVYLIEEDAPNAFATGRNPEHAAVAATTGILRVLTERELRGVMAHELAHVSHRDILISTISATMAGAISMLANFAMFFGGRDSEGRPANPIAGIAGGDAGAAGRRPDPDGDQPGARVRGRPWRRRDLRRPARAGRRRSRRSTAMPQGIPLEAAERNPTTAQMMIMNPLSGGGLRGLFSTHPSTEERVERLLAMASAAGR